MLNQFFKHKKNISFIKVENFKSGYYIGIGFKKNPTTGQVSIEPNTIFNTNEWEEVSKDEFVQKLHEAFDDIYKQINS